MMSLNSQILAGLMGVCIGDALGVPVEFIGREELLKNPIQSMTGHGIHEQPPGTWSDDSSLTFCLAECLCEPFDIDMIADSFCDWYDVGYWTPHGQLFDISGTTLKSLGRIQRGIPASESGETHEFSNGNGSLMRILPMAFLYKTVNFTTLIQQVHDCSAITHAHLRSQMACGVYVSIAIQLLKGLSIKKAYHKGLEEILTLYSQGEYTGELNHFDRIFSGILGGLPSDQIQSGGYVIHTLEAALWCLLNSQSFSEAVLKAVNLGDDTDTTGAVTGGLAGIYYGWENIPSEWVDKIARKDDIIDLANRLASSL